MKALAKAVLAQLPNRAQRSLRRAHFRRQIRKGDFDAGEPEYDRLHEWISAGDVVIDVGANVGHYAAKMSNLVGVTGRVFAFEPIPETFEVLASNLAYLGATNVTLFNCAVSGDSMLVSMSIPDSQAGAKNYYQAKIADVADGVTVFSVSIDTLNLPGPVSMIKIDVEGHEYHAVSGMLEIIDRDRPVLIIENAIGKVSEILEQRGYRYTHIPGSPNQVFIYVDREM